MATMKGNKGKEAIGEESQPEAESLARPFMIWMNMPCFYPWGFTDVTSLHLENLLVLGS